MQRMNIKECINHYYDFSGVSDSVYWFIIDSLRSETNIERAINLLGAWKTGGITRKKTEKPAFDCKCGGEYFFNDLWKTGTSASFDIWTGYLTKEFKHLKNAAKTNGDQLIDDVSKLTYRGAKSPNTRFGEIYAITYLHFLNPEDYPIFDMFVYLGATGNITIPKKYKEQYEEYKKIFHETKIKENISGRDLDKAFWAKGHIIKKSRILSIKPCCFE